MKITLISPPSPHRVSADPNGLPLGLCMLASMVRDIADVSIIDGYSKSLSTDVVIDHILQNPPDIAAISMPFAFSEKNASIIAREIKVKLPDIITITGGNQATFRSERIIANDIFDFIVIGEGEISFRNLILKIITDGINCARTSPPYGVKTKNADYIPQPLISDIDSLPHPSFDLLPGFPGFYLPRIITSRGCPFTCPYCSTMQFWTKKYRGRSSDSIISELTWLNESWGISRVSFADDTFNINRKRCREIADALIAADIGIQWGASMRPDLVTKSDIDLYVKSGMTGLFFGMESGSEKILREIHRNHDLDTTRDLIDFAVNLGVDVHCSFMLGLPGETTDDMQKTLDYAKSLSATSLGFHIFHPLPGSEYGENIDGFGIEFENPEMAIETLGSIDGGAPIRTKYLTAMQIVDYYSIARGIASNFTSHL